MGAWSLVPFVRFAQAARDLARSTGRPGVLRFWPPPRNSHKAQDVIADLLARAYHDLAGDTVTAFELRMHRRGIRKILPGR